MKPDATPPAPVSPVNCIYYDCCHHVFGELHNNTTTLPVIIDQMVLCCERKERVGKIWDGIS